MATAVIQELRQEQRQEYDYLRCDPICVNEYTIKGNPTFIVLMKGDIVLDELPHHHKRPSLYAIYLVYKKGRVYVLLADRSKTNIYKVNIVGNKLVREQNIRLYYEMSPFITEVFTLVDTDGETGFVFCEFSITHRKYYALRLVTFVDHEMVEMWLSEEFSAKLNIPFKELIGERCRSGVIRTIVQWNIYAKMDDLYMGSYFIEYKVPDSICNKHSKFSIACVKYNG